MVVTSVKGNWPRSRVIMLGCSVARLSMSIISTPLIRRRCRTFSGMWPGQLWGTWRTDWWPIAWSGSGMRPGGAPDVGVRRRYGAPLLRSSFWSRTSVLDVRRRSSGSSPCQCPCCMTGNERASSWSRTLALVTTHSIHQTRAPAIFRFRVRTLRTVERCWT